MSAFNRRIEPKEIYGFSAQAVIYGGLGIVLAVMAIFLPLILQILLFIASAGCLAWAVYQAVNHKQALLLKAMRLSAREGRCYSKESLNPF